MVDLLNGSALAYVGDAVYEMYVRKHVVNCGITQPNKLHKAAIKYVEAAGQAYIIKKWLETDEVLTSQEIEFYKRGRNHKSNTKAKNASIGDYRQATGFEALIGWLHLTQQTDRERYLIELAIQTLDERSNP